MTEQGKMIRVSERFLEDYACTSYGRGSHAQRCGAECDSEPEFQFCCVKMGFCHWYQSWWFMFTGIGVSAFLLLLGLIIICYCCCSRSGRY